MAHFHKGWSTCYLRMCNTRVNIVSFDFMLILDKDLFLICWLNIVSVKAAVQKCCIDTLQKANKEVALGPRRECVL